VATAGLLQFRQEKKKGVVPYLPEVFNTTCTIGDFAYTQGSDAVGTNGRQVKNVSKSTYRDKTGNPSAIAGEQMYF